MEYLKQCYKQCGKSVLLMDTCLFGMILYVPVNSITDLSEWLFLGWTNTKQGWMYLAQEHNAVMPVSLEPATPWYCVEHSTNALPIKLGLNWLYSFIWRIHLIPESSKKWLKLKYYLNTKFTYIKICIFQSTECITGWRFVTCYEENCFLYLHCILVLSLPKTYVIVIMVCSQICWNNPRASASGLSHVQVD